MNLYFINVRMIGIQANFQNIAKIIKNKDFIKSKKSSSVQPHDDQLIIGHIKNYFRHILITNIRIVTRFLTYL